MKSLCTISVMVLGFLASEKAIAQSGLNNNSNWKTPIPNIKLPQSPTSATNAVPTGTVIQNTFKLPVLPSLPPLTNINIPTSIPNMAMSTIIPAIPLAPNAPLAPTANFISAMPSALPNVSLPLLPILPPVSPIAPVPELRLVIKP